MPKLLRQALPHIIAVLTFLVVSVVFFSPVMFEGKELYQHDILQGAASNQEVEEYREQGIEPYWTNSMFSGMPSFLITAHYPGDLLRYVRDVYSLGLPAPVMHLFAALLSFYLLLLCCGVRPSLATVGGLAYGLSTFLLISLEAGHNSKVLAMAYAPLVIAGVITAFKQKYWWGFALTALGLALHLRANHLQITYYLLLILLLFALFLLVEVVRNRLPWKQLLKPGLLLIGAALLALLANFGKIYDTYSYGKYSIRGKAELSPLPGQEAGGNGLDREYAFAWSNGLGETLTLIVPYFYGGASQEQVDEKGPLAQALQKNGLPPQQVNEFIQQAPTYWGDQPFTAGPFYLGITVFLFFIVGVGYAPRQYRGWLASVVILGLILSYGKNLAGINNILFDYLPGYNKFRAVTMALFMVMLAVPLLGFMGLEVVARDAPHWSKPQRRKFWYTLGSALGVLVLVWLASFSLSYAGAVDQQLAQYPAWLLTAIREQRESLLRSDLGRSFILLLLAGGAIYYFLVNKGSVLAASLALFALLAFDLIGVNKRYLAEDDFRKNVSRQYFAPSPANQRILADQDLSYRVLNLRNPWNESKTSYFHMSVGGYHGAKMQRYQDLIDRVLGPESQQLISSLQQGNPDFEALSALNMLNTRYFLAGDQAEAVIRNPEALGNAWAVEEVLSVNSADEEILTLKGLNTAQVAVVDGSKFNLSPNSEAASGQVELTAYQPNRLNYQASMQSGGLVVFSEIYYPDGWTAYIDGQETPIYRANYVLRALQVPAGEHKIIFEYEPPHRGLIFTLMIGSSMLILIALGLAIWKGDSRLPIVSKSEKA